MKKDGLMGTQGTVNGTMGQGTVNACGTGDGSSVPPFLAYPL